MWRSPLRAEISGSRAGGPTAGIVQQTIDPDLLETY